MSPAKDADSNYARWHTSPVRSRLISEPVDPLTIEIKCESVCVCPPVNINSSGRNDLQNTTKSPEPKIHPEPIHHFIADYSTQESAVTDNWIFVARLGLIEHTHSRTHACTRRTIPTSRINLCTVCLVCLRVCCVRRIDLLDSVARIYCLYQFTVFVSHASIRRPDGGLMMIDMNVMIDCATTTITTLPPPTARECRRAMSSTTTGVFDDFDFDSPCSSRTLGQQFRVFQPSCNLYPCESHADT